MGVTAGIQALVETVQTRNKSLASGAHSLRKQTLNHASTNRRGASSKLEKTFLTGLFARFPFQVFVYREKIKDVWGSTEQQVEMSLASSLDATAHIGC